MLAPHHGAEDTLDNREWARATKPKILVVSSGGLYHHPRCEAVETYNAFLYDANNHNTLCYTKTGQDTFTYTLELNNKARYDTLNSGLIVLEFNENQQYRLNTYP